MAWSNMNTLDTGVTNPDPYTIIDVNGFQLLCLV